MTQQDTETEPELSDELARKYDPERLLRLVSLRAGKGELLDHSIRAKYEKRFGVDLGHVRVYTGEFAEEFNRKHGSYAVTIGSTGMIMLGGSPDKAPGSVAGQALLAHELTHVAQAHKGVHRKTVGGGMPFAEEHEAEAEAVEQSVAASGGDPTGGDSTSAAANAGVRAMQSKEALEQAIVKIKERTQELLAEFLRNEMLRNGIQRRP